MFFILSKIFWFIFDPSQLLFFSLILVFILVWFKKFLFVKWFLGVTIFIMLIVATLPLGNRLMVALEERFPRIDTLPEDVAGIIVLGGIINQFISADRGVISLGGPVERLIYFSILSQKYPNAKLVFSGGSGKLSNQNLKEADFASPVLVQLGLDTSKIIFENNSKNTWENSVFTKDIVKPTKDELWIIITSAFHMPRAMGVFRKTGWNVLAYPVSYQTLKSSGSKIGFSFASGMTRLAYGLHEWAGLLAYWLTGRSSEIFPSAKEAS